jgi:ABC-type transport system involved in multi-copper enzyme maturation permease subunit
MTTMLRQILIHARNSMSHSLRSGSGVAFIVLTILAGLALANLAFAPIELGFIELEQFRDNAAQGIGLVLSLATLQQGDPEAMLGRMESGELVEMTMWARYLVLEKPMLLSITVLLLGLILPLLLPLGSFAAISGDVQHRSIRYVLPRTTRTSLLLGRLLGCLLLAWILITALVAAIVMYLGIVLSLDSWDALIPWGLSCLGALLVLSFPYVCLGILCSTLCRVPLVALFASTGITVAVPLIAFSARAGLEPLGKLLYLLPWGYSHQLLSPDSQTVSQAMLYCLGHGLVFIAIALHRFRRADL